MGARYRPRKKKKRKLQEPASYKVKTSRDHENYTRRTDMESDRREAYRATKNCRKVKKGSVSFTVCGVK